MDKIYLVVLVLVALALNAAECCPSCCTIPDSITSTNCGKEDDALKHGQCWASCISYYLTPMFTVSHEPWPTFAIADNTMLDRGNMSSCYRNCISPYCNQLCTDVPCQSVCNRETGPVLSAPLEPASLQASNVNYIQLTAKDAVIPGGAENVTADSAGSGFSLDVYAFIAKVSTGNNTSYCFLQNLRTSRVTVDRNYLCSPTSFSYAVINQYGRSGYSPETVQCVGEYNRSAVMVEHLDYCIDGDLREGFEEHTRVTFTWDLIKFEPECALGTELRLSSSTFGCDSSTMYKSVNNTAKSLTLTSSNVSHPLLDINCQYVAVMVADGTKIGETHLVRLSTHDKCSSDQKQIIVPIVTHTLNENCNYVITVEWKVKFEINTLEHVTNYTVEISERNDAEPNVKQTKKIRNLFNDFKFMPSRMDSRFFWQCDVPYRQYECDEVCNITADRASYQNCLSDCNNVTRYQVQFEMTPNAQNQHYTVEIKPELNDFDIVISCPFKSTPFEKNILSLPGCIPAGPTGISYSVQSFEGNDLLINVTWNKLEFGGTVRRYVVYIGTDRLMPQQNELIDNSNNYRTTSNMWISSSFQVFRERELILQVRADTEYTTGTWSDPVVIDPITITSSSESDSNPLVFVFAIVGSLFGLALLVLLFTVMCFAHRYIKSRRLLKSDDYDAQKTNGSIDSLMIDFDQLPTDDWELSPECVVMQQLLGTGNFGEVYKAVVSGPTNAPGCRSPDSVQQVAVKLLQSGAASDMKHEFLQEIAMMKRVAAGNSPYVVNMIGCCVQQEPLALVLEFVPNGNLLNYLRESRIIAKVQTRAAEQRMLLAPYNDMQQKMEAMKTATENVSPTAGHIKAVHNSYVEDSAVAGMQNSSSGVIDTSSPELNTYYNIGGLKAEDLVQFAWQIASGMKFLESLKVVHRDLACRNVLIGDGKRIKVSDFGLARSIAETSEYVKKSDGKLPLRWMALESIMERKFTHQSDVWSFGVTLWEISTLGGYPYPTVSNKELLQSLMDGHRLEQPKNCAKEIYSLMFSCWNLDPDRRPTFSQLQETLDKMLAEHNQQYIEINLVDDPYCQMFPAQDIEEDRMKSPAKADSVESDNKAIKVVDEDQESITENTLAECTTDNRMMTESSV